MKIIINKIVIIIKQQKSILLSLPIGGLLSLLLLPGQGQPSSRQWVLPVLRSHESVQGRTPSMNESQMDSNTKKRKECKHTSKMKTNKNTIVIDYH